MVKGSTLRKSVWPINPLFLDRWSPRSMTGEAISEQELMVLFEAARWAPSSMNSQPWRILYARRDTASWPIFLELLVEDNRVWAHRAGALLLFVSKTVFDRDSRPSVTHSYETGAAWQNLALQGTLLKLAVHGMEGFDYARARTALQIPAEFQVNAMAAVGRPGDKSLLPERLQLRESPNDRRPLDQTICEGVWTL